MPAEFAPLEEYVTFSRMLRVFCDFDGTITDRDSIVFLTESFGGGADFREDVLLRIVSGEITVFEAIEHELATVRVQWEEALGVLLAEIRIDPFFESFVEWCRDQGVPLSILSSGMRPVVEAFVGRFDVPIFAHSVEFGPEGWRYRREAENDKPALLAAVPEGDEVVYIGDGTSDVAAIPLVDHLFAKEGRFLAEHCRANHIAFTPFRDFAEIRAAVAQLLVRSRGENRTGN
ncbi:MAG: MtnX-like HAD-IB family phosphatase [Acidobacteriota bacterium]